MNVLAVDPGLSGAVVRITYPAVEIQARRDFGTLRDIASAVTELAPGCDFAAVELVGSRPGQGVVSTFSFGRSAGVAMGALFAAGLQFIEIDPKKWQNWWAKTSKWTGEFDSRQIAMRRFVQHAHLFKRQLDHNTADALLIAYYAANQAALEGEIETSRGKGEGMIGSPHVIELGDAPSNPASC